MTLATHMEVKELLKCAWSAHVRNMQLLNRIIMNDQDQESLNELFELCQRSHFLQVAKLNVASFQDFELLFQEHDNLITSYSKEFQDIGPSREKVYNLRMDINMLSFALTAFSDEMNRATPCIRSAASW